MYVSTLRRYIEAMGGELEIIAHFPEGNVRINLFEEANKSGRISLLGCVYAMSGNRLEATKILDHLAEQSQLRYVSRR